jgi:hypothetical protein
VLVAGGTTSHRSDEALLSGVSMLDKGIKHLKNKLGVSF